jgi:hypothetical protein
MLTQVIHSMSKNLKTHRYRLQQMQITPGGKLTTVTRGPFLIRMLRSPHREQSETSIVCLATLSIWSKFLQTAERGAPSDRTDGQCQLTLDSCQCREYWTVANRQTSRQNGL